MRTYYFDSPNEEEIVIIEALIANKYDFLPRHQKWRDRYSRINPIKKR